VVKGRVGGHHPPDVIEAIGLQRERQAFGTEPEPDLAHRPQFGEAREDGADRARDGFVRVEANLAVRVTPDEADRESPTQRAARGLVANAAFEAAAEDMQFGFTHGAFEPQDQAVVKEGWVVDTVGIGDQGVGHPAQPVPVRVIASQARHLETQDDADFGQGDVGSQPGEAGALGDSGARDAQVVVDDHDLVAVPAEIDCAMDQRVLPFGRLPVVLDLRGARLPDVDDGGAMRVGQFDLGEITHRAASTAGCVAALATRRARISARLDRYVRGWGEYFKRASVAGVFDRYDRWILRRLRAYVAKRWRNGLWRRYPDRYFWVHLGLTRLYQLRRDFLRDFEVRRGAGNRPVERSAGDPHATFVRGTEALP
jgi:hypothetical protein